MIAVDLTERIEQVFLSGVRAETTLGLAERLNVDEDDLLVALIGIVASGALHLHEVGGLLVVLTPDRSRELALAA